MIDNRKIEDLEIEYQACKQLASSVILLALDDALVYRETKCFHDVSCHRKTKAEAILFCSETRGEFKRSREFWCDIAGISSEFIVKAYNRWSGDINKYAKEIRKYKNYVQKQCLSEKKRLHEEKLFTGVF